MSLCGRPQSYLVCVVLLSRLLSQSMFWHGKRAGAFFPMWEVAQPCSHCILVTQNGSLTGCWPISNEQDSLTLGKGTVCSSLSDLGLPLPWSCRRVLYCSLLSSHCNNPPLISEVKEMVVSCGRKLLRASGLSCVLHSSFLKSCSTGYRLLARIYQAALVRLLSGWKIPK